MTAQHGLALDSGEFIPADQLNQTRNKPMTTTNTQGAAIARYKIGYYSDDWGIRTSTPSALLDEAGTLVQYADHIAAMQETEATHLRELAAYRLTVENLEREIARLEGEQSSDDLDIVYMEGYRSGLKARQPAPSPAPAVHSRHPVVVRWRNDGIEACAGIAEYYGCTSAARDMRVMLTAAPTAQADSQPAPTHAQIAAYLKATGAYVTNDATREAAIAEAISADRAARKQGGDL